MDLIRAGLIVLTSFTHARAGGAQTIQTGPGLKKNLASNDGVPGYRTYDQTLEELRKIESDHPAICKLYDIGDSRGKEYFLQGREAYRSFNHDIWGLKVSGNVEKTEDEPAIIFCGEHHAREPISLEVTMGVLNYIIANYGKDSSVTKNVDSKEIWFVPLVNPDGHQVVVSGFNTGWRKNIRDNDSSGQFDENDGVDLNRNYGYAWGGPSTSTDQANELYPGPSAWSEPEVRAVKSLIDLCCFVAGISYHSYQQDVLYPYAYAADARTPDQAALADLATKMAATIPAIGQAGSYMPLKWSAMYEAGGILDDYAYASYGTFLFTIELGIEFIPPADSIPRISNDNIHAAMLLLNRLNIAALAGHAYAVTATGRTPLTGQVDIDQIDDTVATNTNYRAPIKTNSTFGAYRRLLMPGTYTVTFRPDSTQYSPMTVSGVTIKSDDITLLDFACARTAGRFSAHRPIPASEFRAIKTGPHTVCIFMAASPSERNLDIFTLAGKKVDHRRIPASFNATDAKWDTRLTPAGIYIVKLSDLRSATATSITVTLSK